MIEDRQSAYVNYVVGRPGAEKDVRVRKLVAALHSAQTRAFIDRTYNGAVLPAF